MAKISLSYPDTWLTINISVRNRDTGIEDFSWVMDEVDGTYKYDFVEEPNTDYVYTAICATYSDLRWTIYRDGGGLTIEQAIELSNTVKTGDTILNLGEISIPL